MGIFKPNIEKLKQKKDIEGLIKVLENKFGFRSDAAEALGEIGDARAVEPLIQSLLIDNIQKPVREKIIEALGKMRDVKAVDPLIKALKHYDEKVRASAAKALGEIGDVRAVNPLIEALIRGYGEDKYNAIKALENIGDPRAINPLIQVKIKAQKGGNRGLKRKASKALKKIGWEPDDIERIHYHIAAGNWKECVEIGDPAIEPLIKALKDGDDDVRSGAAEALGEIGDSRAVEPLINVLKEDKIIRIREKAAATLGKIGDKRAVEPLIQALDGLGVLSNAAPALGNIRDDRAVEPLFQVLKDQFSKISSNSIIKALIDIENENPGSIVDKKYASIIIEQVFKFLSDWKPKDYSPAFKNLFEDYTSLIFESAGYNIEYHDGRGEKNVYTINTEVVKKLCNILSPISNNILHKITNKKDFEVMLYYQPACEGGSEHGILSFKSQREMARKELDRRGNPPYDPSAYLDKDAWKLAQEEDQSKENIEWE